MALESVIKRVDRQADAQRGEVYLSIREDNGELNPRFAMLATVHHYCVSTESAGKPPAKSQTGILPVADPDQPRDVVNLRITYQATCPDGHAEKLVKGLGQRGDPDRELNIIVTAAARAAFQDKERELFSNFRAMRDVIAEGVCTQVTGETGLRFRAEVALELEEQLVAYPIDEHLEVRFKDSPTTHRLRLQCDLDLLPRLTLKAIVSYSRLLDLRTAFIQEVKDYFRLEVRAQDYALGLRDPVLLEGLQARVADRLAAEGRYLTGLALTATDIDKRPPDSISHRLVSEIPALNREKSFELTSEVLLSLEDYAEYQRAQVRDIHAWLDAEFKKVVKDVCFEKQLLDYLRRDSWAAIKDAIKSGMAARVRKIGYSLKQILSTPGLKENQFSSMRPHRLPVKRLPIKSTQGTLVDLTVDATFCIDRWDDEELAQKINQGVDLEVDIRFELHGALAKILVEVPLNDFVLKFSSDDSKESLEGRLGKAVSNALEDVYKAQVSNVVITQVETPEIEKIQDMMHKPMSALFIAKPTTGGPDVTFHATWKVVSLADTSWEIIRRDFCTLENIQVQLEKALASAFSTLTYDVLRYEPSEDRAVLRKAAQSLADMHIPRLFGMCVDITDLYRDRDEREVLVRDADRKEFDARVQNRVAHIDHNTKKEQLQREQELKQIGTTYDSQQRDLQLLLDLRAKPEPNPFEKDVLKVLEAREDLRKAQAAADSANPPVADLPTNPKAYQRAMLGPGGRNAKLEIAAWDQERRTAHAAADESSQTRPEEESSAEDMGGAEVRDSPHETKDQSCEGGGSKEVN